MGLRISHSKVAALTQVTILRKIRGNFQEFLGIRRKFPGIFHRKIRWKCRQQFRGTSRNQFQGTPHNQVRGISSNPFRGISNNHIQGISCNQFQRLSCYQFCRKPVENVDKICGNSWEFPEKSSSEPIPGISWELFPRFSQEFLRNIMKNSHIPEYNH